jgi:hypothetical protein
MDKIFDSFKVNPPSFIRENDPLSEFLSISTLGVKTTQDQYLIPQQEDSCTARQLEICELDNHCQLYKNQCVDSSRIKPFRELSKEMGNRIQSKFTFEQNDFIIHDSSNFYKIIISTKTKRLYVLFNTGSYIFDFKSFNLKQVIDIILSTDLDVNVVLCGHSQGGSLALKTAEIMATYHSTLFKERCTVIALAPFPSLNTDILYDSTNVHVYFTAIKTNENLYIDPVYFKNDKQRKHYFPSTVLLLDKKVTELVVTGDFHPMNETIKETINRIFFGDLHALSTYLNFFYLRKLNGGNRQMRKSRKQRTIRSRKR